LRAFSRLTKVIDIPDLFLPLHSDCSFGEGCFYQGRVFTYNFRPISIQFMGTKMTQWGENALQEYFKQRPI